MARPPGLTPRQRPVDKPQSCPYARAVLQLPEHASRVVGTGTADELAHAHTFKAAGALEDVVLDRPDPHPQHLRSPPVLRSAVLLRVTHRAGIVPTWSVRAYRDRLSGSHHRPPADSRSGPIGPRGSAFAWRLSGSYGWPMSAPGRYSVRPRSRLAAQGPYRHHTPHTPLSSRRPTARADPLPRHAHDGFRILELRFQEAKSKSEIEKSAASAPRGLTTSHGSQQHPRSPEPDRVRLGRSAEPNGHSASAPMSLSQGIGTLGHWERPRKCRLESVYAVLSGIRAQA